MFRKWLVLKLGLSVIIAFACAGMVFILSRTLTSHLIEETYNDSNYVQAKLRTEVDAIQAYVNQHNIALKNFYKVGQWMDRNKITTITLYYKDKLVYDSTISYIAGTLNSGISRRPLPWQTLYPIHLQDVDVLMDLTVYLKHHEYDRVMVMNLILFFSVFLFIVLFFVHRKAAQLLRLEQQVQLMQGGLFHYPIEIKGKDEIASLGRNIEEMRKVFLQQVQAQNQLHTLSRTIISTISHDIRTPLAALIGYLDILIHRRTEDEGKLRQYLLKSAEKANQLQIMTNQLFEHTVVSSDSRTIPGQNGFTDRQTLEHMVSDGVFLLESEGYMAAVSFEEQKDYRIHLGEEFVQRILDNVISNILKYAEPKEPIYIETKREGIHLLLYFRNTICPSKSSQGTGLGLVTCRSILESCHGTVKWSKEGDEFKLWLLVPVEG